MELWTPTCCPETRHLWILRSRWSRVWRRGLSTTGYHFLSVTAKLPVKTSSGKPLPPANSAQNLPTLPAYAFPPSSTWTVVELSCIYHLHRSDMQHQWTSPRQCVCLNKLCIYLCKNAMYLLYVTFSFRVNNKSMDIIDQIVITLNSLLLQLK